MLSVTYNLTHKWEIFHDILINNSNLLQSIHLDQNYDGERKL